MLKITREFGIKTTKFIWDDELKVLKIRINDGYDSFAEETIPFELATQIPRTLEKLMDGE